MIKFAQVISMINAAEDQKTVAVKVTATKKDMVDFVVVGESKQQGFAFSIAKKSCEFKANVGDTVTATPVEGGEYTYSVEAAAPTPAAETQKSRSPSYQSVE